MGKLHLGDVNEMVHRITGIEDNITSVKERLDNIENTKVIKEKQEVFEVPDIVFE